MRNSSKAKILAAAAFVTLTPATAIAQNAADNTTTTMDDGTTTTRTVERDNDFPWGLLGLLGLAGLLGRKKKDADIHVDARHNTRP